MKINSTPKIPQPKEHWKKYMHRAKYENVEYLIEARWNKPWHDIP